MDMKMEDKSRRFSYPAEQSFPEAYQASSSKTLRCTGAPKIVLEKDPGHVLTWWYGFINCNLLSAFHCTYLHMGSHWGGHRLVRIELGVSLHSLKGSSLLQEKKCLPFLCDSPCAETEVAGARGQVAMCTGLWLLS
jgi:hypothetical protein